MTPLTTEDLYGPTKSQEHTPEPAPTPVIPDAPQEPTVAVPAGVGNNQPLVIEETPEVPMDTPSVVAPPVAEPAEPTHTVPPAPPMPKKSFLSTLLLIVLFIGLFGAGIFLSQWARQFFQDGAAPGLTRTPTPTPGLTTTPIDPFADWIGYSVISGITKQPVDGVSFKLPSDVLSPICDGSSCASQGTYLPGGTRFTVAPRGAGQILADFRGSSIADVGGITFTTTDATVAGHKAKEFTGVFTGRTVSGYAFTRMHGFMIEVTSTLSLEINHFTPTGVTADFAADDALFAQIVKTLDFAAAAPITTIIPIATSSSKGATGSGN